VDRNEIKMRDAILRRQALDRIQIGLNGTSQQPAAGMANNDPTLVGMNIGWPQWMLNNNAERVLSSGAVAGKLTYGASADYATVDAMLYEVRMELLPPWMRERDDLVWICGSDMIKDKMLPIANRGEGSLDMIAQFQLMTGKATLGYIPAYRVPSMPAGTALCTPLSNLSLYYQTGGMRRMLRDEPQWNRVVDYNSSNEAYVVEDPNAICMVQNVQPVTAVSDPAGLQEIADNTDAPQ